MVDLAPPAAFQEECADFVYERDRSMIWARMGTGKTRTYLMAAQAMIEANIAGRINIVAPLRVIKNVWPQEIAKWRFPLTHSTIVGGMKKDDVQAALKADTQLLLINNENAPWLWEQGKNAHGCTAVYFDELSKYRNHSGTWQKAAKKAGFDFTCGGTGTPAPNGLMAVFGMCRALGLEPFGRSYDKFLRKYFFPTDFEQRKWEAFKDTPTELAAILKPFTYVLEDNAVELPTIIRPPIDIDLPDHLRSLYNRLRKESTLSDLDIVAGSAGVLRNKLRQVCSGFVYDNKGKPVHLSPWRLGILEDIVGEMQGRPLIIAYEFIEQLEMLKRKWPRAPWMGHGSRKDDETIARWNRGELELMFLHPGSAGHGLNLQGGGSAIAWWTLTDDQELYHQTIARLVRRGALDDHVYSYEPVARGTIETTVRARGHEKDATQESLWAALRR